jgi:hypothetical protein
MSEDTIRSTLKDFVAAQGGFLAASKMLGVSETTLARFAAGARCRQGTIALIGLKLGALHPMSMSSSPVVRA